MSQRPVNRFTSESKFDKDFDRMFDGMEKNSGRIFKGAVVIWVLSLIASLVFLGVVIWGIIALVTHFTA